MEKGFIKNEENLEETCNVPDQLDSSVQIESFKKKLSKIEKPSILALVGRFGIGKSTMLYQLEQELLQDNSIKWINFDAWKYPDRKDLWEGFVLDVSREMDAKAFEEVRKKVDGKQNNDKKVLIETLSDIPIPGFSAIKNLNHFFETSPARRVFEIQEIMQDLFINRKESQIYIVVEDIDRSGDSGIFFLETLKQFLRNLNVNKTIIVIVPISDHSYEKKMDSYLKCIDFFEFFSASSIKLHKFVEGNFEDGLFKGEEKLNNGHIAWTGEQRKTQTISFLDLLFQNEPIMTMRFLKLILRKANAVYKSQFEDGHNPDFRVTICVEASKYFIPPNISEHAKDTYFDKFKLSKKVSQGSVFSAFLFAMLRNSESLMDGHDERKVFYPNFDIDFITRKGTDISSYPSIPYKCSNFEEKYCIADFYLNY